MYKIFLSLFLVVLFSACGKDKYTTEPQLTFKSFNPNQSNNLVPYEFQSTIKLEVRDKEGDIGLNAGKDTAFIFIREM